MAKNEKLRLVDSHFGVVGVAVTFHKSVGSFVESAKIIIGVPVIKLSVSTNIGVPDVDTVSSILTFTSAGIVLLIVKDKF
ncbi:MAG: hypothetical protein MZV64_54140 [Ignavibacteriales bacterium]|nr:hypothetical protein [Ignavibacteriales bacterium]